MTTSVQYGVIHVEIYWGLNVVLVEQHLGVCGTITLKNTSRVSNISYDFI